MWCKVGKVRVAPSVILTPVIRFSGKFYANYSPLFPIEIFICIIITIIFIIILLGIVFPRSVFYFSTE